MYKPIQMTDKYSTGLFNLNNFNENTDTIKLSTNDLFQEAVFNKGREQIMPLVEHAKIIKDSLEKQVVAQEKKKSTFDPKAFWKDLIFKDFEDALQKVFGFRSVSIQPYIEKYITSDKIFQSNELNAFTYTMDRFPIDGLVTDKGFYDDTHSIILEIHMSLGIIRVLEPEEIIAVLLHEIGHNIDPALVDIKYARTNKLSDYLLDRVDVNNKNGKNKLAEEFIMILMYMLPFAIYAIYRLIIHIVSLIKGNKVSEKTTQRKLNKIKRMMDNDELRFNRQNYSEAFADNFARMYGMSAELMKALYKLSKNIDDNVSRMKLEIDRQNAITNITAYLIKDVHKTDIHRIKSLIYETKQDLNDPNIPKVVKQQIESDLKDLEDILDQYLNNFGEFQNRVNRLISDELDKVYVDEDETDTTTDDTLTDDKSKLVID